MSTKKQIKYYRYLCEQACIEPEEDCEDWSFEEMSEKIAELNTVIKPTLVIMDARKCFVTKGPSQGKVESPGLLLASESRVAVDVEGVKIIQSFPGNSLEGLNPLELTQIEASIRLGENY